MYTITLADGTQLKNLTLNGNNYIATTLIDSSVFEDNLWKVTISDGKTSETFEDMVLVQNTPFEEGKSWFILAEKSEQEKREEIYQAEITELQLALVELYEMMGG